MTQAQRAGEPLSSVTVVLRDSPDGAPLVLGWLVSPTVVITDATARRFDRPPAKGGQTSLPGAIVVTTLDGGQTSQGTAQRVDREAGFAVIGLERAIESRGTAPLETASPEAGAGWTAATADGRLVRGRVARALREEGNLQFGSWLRMEHGDDAAALAGAPFLTDGGRVAGLLVASLAGREPACYGIPVAALAAAPGGEAIRARLTSETPPNAPQSKVPTVVELPGDPLFQNLAASAVAALNLADGIRRKLSHERLSVEALLGGLAGDSGGSLAALMAEARMSPDGLRAALAAGGGASLPAPGESPPSTLTTAPALSESARTAMGAARRIADATNGGVVEDRHLLYGALSVPGPLGLALRDAGLRRENLGLFLPRRGEIAALRPDTAQGEDKLGLEREVEALAAVLAARDVQPPLSVGLFGDWGSGKSFFMRELEKAINRFSLSARGDPKSPYCERVGQLWFNAWHYMDTDLWASLASEIFEKLAAFLDKQTDEATRAAGGLTPRERLFAAAVNTRDVLTQAEQVRDAAQRELDASRKRLESVAGSEAEVEASLGTREILRSAFKTALARPEVSDKVREAARGLGLTTAASAATDVKAQVLELAGAAGYLRGALLMLRHGGKRIWILSLVLVVALAVGIPVAYAWAVRNGMPALVGRVTAGLTALIALLAPVLPRVRKAMDLVQAVRADNAAVIEQARRRKTEAAEAIRARHASAVEQAQARVEEARTELTRVEQQLEELRADRQVGAFIRERFASSDYTKHFGTIARARNDFERLTELFDQVRKELSANQSKPGTFPRIDRIILYIDDLDRCPEDKVFAVMQAVHLLLAMPLFVVVVGVDSRWLMHSLRSQAGALRGEEDGKPAMDLDMPEDERIHWQSTPLNYLEKIFQIPFTLRPMEPDGFGHLIDDLVRPPATVAPPAGAAPQGASPPAPAPATPAAGAAPAPGGGTPATAPAAATPQAPAPVTPAPARPVSPAMAAQILKIEEWESATMKHLFPLIPSPRSAKRFVNVYRLLRATIPEDEYDAFVRKEGGDYEVVLLLLAMLTGHPGPTTEILRDLIVERPPGDWWAFVARYEARGKEPLVGADGEAPLFEERVEIGRWADLWKDLEPIRKRFPSVGAASRFAKRAPVVARFSFQSGRVLLDKGMEAARLARGSGGYGVRRSGAVQSKPPA